VTLVYKYDACIQIHSFVTNSRAERMSTSILEDITQALDTWSQQLLDVEIKVRNIEDYRENLVGDLRRNVQEGIISEVDFKEFEYTTDLWINLYKAVLFHSVGAEFSDRDIVFYLLELFQSKQISKETFVEIILESCRFTK